MNRGVIGALVTGALVSAMAAAPTAPVPGGPPASERSGALGGLSRRGGGRGGDAAPLDTRQTIALAAQARRHYAMRLEKLFRDVCPDSAGELGAERSAKPAPFQTDRPGTWATALWKPCKPAEQRLLVALVPDPVHTRLALTFDRMVEVIQQASQDQGFQFVKAALPWDPKVYPESDQIANRLRAEDYAEALRDLPGVLGFRCVPTSKPGSCTAGQHLFVLLVSESPTGGVSRKQFQNAICWIRQTRSSGKDGAMPALRILGPTFSGSLASLAQLLLGQREAGSWPSLVFSGTVTSRQAGKTFKAAVRSATFASFQESDEEAIALFKHFVGADRQRAPREGDPVAVLSEDETEYGFGPPDPTRGFYLPFPREISRLRAAYQGIAVSGVTPDAQSGPRRVLPPNLEISGADDDTIATFAKQSPLSQEAVLLGIVSELRKHAVQYVLLRATDPMDLLFLSRYIASAYPRGRIVTLGADLLFRREVEDSQLHGILALSTYSLAPTSNHGYLITPSGRIERQFPSTNEIGAYNALSALLYVPEGPQRTEGGRYRLPPDLPLQQYGWREAWLGLTQGKACAVEAWRCNYPPVHLLALGHDEYWPIAHLGAQDPCSSWLPIAESPQLDDNLLQVTAPISWVAAELIALLLAVGLASMLWLSSLRSPSQICASVAPATANHGAAVIAFSIYVVASMVTLLFVPLLDGDGWPIFPRVSLLCVLVVALLAILVALIDLLDRLMRPRGAQPRLSFLVSTAGGIGILVSTLCFVWAPRGPCPNGVWRFQVLRSLQLTSGLSPVLPLLLLLAAWVWWAVQTSAGIALLDERRPRLPSGVSDDVRLQNIAEGTDEDNSKKTYVVDELLDALRPGAASLRHLLGRFVLPGILSGLALALPWGSAQWSPGRMGMSVETSGFDRTLILFVWLVFAGILGTTLRIWEIWVKSRRLLTALDSLQLRDGFRRLKGFSWTPFWRLDALMLAQAQRMLARVLEAHLAAENQLPAPRDGQVSIGMENLRAKWNDIVGRSSPFGANWLQRRNEEAEIVEDYGRVQGNLARDAGQALKHLAEYWSEPSANPFEAAQAKATARARERFVCLVYVSFIQVVFVRLRTLMMAAGGMYVLVAVAMTVYPFQPRAAIALLLGVLLAWLVAVVTVVLAQVHRNATLSHLMDTTPGELGGDFWIRATSFGAVSVFTFLASQFPQINRLLYSWLEPALRALNK